jgi:ubiquinone/menaquinone biosynthesis C-methylase UbiE
MTKKNYWIKKKGKKGEIIWRKGRAQGLEGAKGRIGNISEQIKELLKKKKKIKILEVGTGFGRALLELKQIYGERIEVTGTNYEKEWNQKLTNEYSLDQGFQKREIPKVITNVDAGKKLPFKKDAFDFIFCQATMQYILDRSLFIEEVNRLLTKEGLAVLELQEIRKDHPPEYYNLFEIWNDTKQINVLSYLKKFKNIKIKKSRGRYWHYLIMKKVKKLDLKLKLNAVIDVEAISEKFWGSKLVYMLK